MKKLLLAVFVLAMMGFSYSAKADGKIKLSVGGDVLIPTGDFGDAFSTGFGGSVSGEYMVSPMANITLRTGYFTWSAKDLPSGFDAKFKGVPVLAGLKYYFMPEGSARVYGHGELGLFFGTAEATVVVLGQSYSGSVSETKFTIAPALGVEIPAGSSASIDVSARYLIISTDPSSNSIGFRAAVNFGLGN